MRYIFLVLALMTIASLATPLLAHHSFAAEYDSKQPITLKGAVTKIEWMNPHVYFYIDVRDEQTGKIENWACEMVRTMLALPVSARSGSSETRYRAMVTSPLVLV